ncbi:6-phosphofructokinase [Paramicrobacterium fandaimingii]|uniref:6-phosphofructokinase n=1 Tax=Paramicrobacterium fandaimingii TaxID=2708079 RepID=UPI0014219DD9|nr:6-phosphofructokinase [Microbacterium fandaimingii]
MTIAIAQTGAPTAVVNRSLAGFMRAVGQTPVLFGRGGPDALVDGTLTTERPTDADLQRTGSWLRGGRRAVSSDDLDAIIENLESAGVTGLALIGGNGTMAFLDAISTRAAERNTALRVVGIPKTIDNDIVGIDHTPGFPSAARYLAATATDMARDHEAMAGIEKVRIVEVMGRDTGWLALAASFHNHDPEYAADLVLTPEDAFDLDEALARIDSALTAKGRAFVIVSEGVAPELTRQPVKAQNHTRLIQGGVARVLAQAASDSLGVTARGEVLGTAQRCNSALISPVDAREAHQLGELAGRWLVDPAGPTDVMAALDRDGTAATLALTDVAGRVRHVPDEWRSADPRDLRAFHTWLSPLVALP